MRSLPPLMTALLLFAFAATPLNAEPPSTSTAPAAVSQDQIRSAIRDLNHPAIARRRAAIRQLAGWGPVAFPELRQAAQDRNLEAALSARTLLAELESALMLGARVRIELNKSRVAWNEPVNLTVFADNRTAAPMRVPWPKPPAQPATRGILTEA